MYFKIALNNVRKSFKDYSIYFLTLTLGVCIFYAFNSIGDQKAFLELGKRQAEYIKVLQGLISGISVFISCVLGGLILYANNFLVKKRKKELGIYMTLGMGKNKISKILTYETALVGIISLVVGLGVGVIVSQGISAFASKLFEVSLSNYKFLLSTDAILKTVLYFGIIFILVMIFNTFVISKYKLIDMLTAAKKNEDIKIKNPILTAIIFFISLGLLGVAYKLVIKVGLNPTDRMFLVSIVLGILGTLLLFFSLAGFVLYVLQRNKNVYLKGLNIFVLRQMNSKINTNFLSMTVICLMLFLTISTLATGLSFKNALEKGLENTTPFDASATYYIDEDSKIKTAEESIKELGFKFNPEDKIVSYNEYKLEKTNLESLLNKNAEGKNIKDIVEAMTYKGTNAISISSYNNIRALSGEKSVSLANNEVLISSNLGEVENTLKNILKNNEKIEIDGKEYKIANNALIGEGKVIKEAFESTGMTNNFFTLIVPDNIVSNLKPIANKININFPKNSNEEERVQKLFNEYRDGVVDSSKYGFVNGYTKARIYEDNNGMTNIVLFIGIYLGVIFLISSTAVLALQQLSEASDSIDRYKSLRRIGVSQKMINKSIFTQVSIYFGLPLVVALVHSVVAIKVVNGFLTMFNRPDIGASSLVTALIMVIVYGGYFYATYTGYKSTVKNALKQK
ncbi:MAG: FtsX-like permease family protein [Clostridium perfringens]|uniref:FtsX-like permease family protein n=1 Tax=Clostridium perfringens TaxID=1502 RepID=UPI0013E3BA27|nr:FtsX-like permease family protein [Clostridium perfringens]MBO3319398.1 FtsX-like permease family protein [Clostridium perfringens]MDK0835914.1 FtsX-like permease family protein [Clostridium perfringens]MDU1112858.1 FtsX-like permease family protein [Clostridium perfringens]MDU1597073.1 FtsX-like permease family protein [Clostridium perfringens]MDU1957817.1 FtsX-like permease family protein [Clostridium perfringens]